MATDFYDLLDVSPDASQKEIKSAYRQKAREYHPDVNDDDRATAQFTTIRKAYKVLSDEKERSAYDRMGHGEYVNTRMDLPKGGMGRSGSRWNTDGSSSSRSARSSGTATGSKRDRRKRSTGSSSGSSSSRSTSRTSSTTSRTRTGTGSTTRDWSSTESKNGAKNGPASRVASSTKEWDSARTSPSEQERASQRAAESESTSSTRSPLWYGWTAVLVAWVGYLAGLWVFFQTSAAQVTTLASRIAASPTAALGAPSGLEATALAQETLSSVTAGVVPPFDAVFVVGAVAYPLVFLAVVKRFGRGSAWLYPLAALGPLVALVAGATLPAVAALDLALLVVLPVVAGLVFLVDVGLVLASME